MQQIAFGRKVICQREIGCEFLCFPHLLFYVAYLSLAMSHVRSAQDRSAAWCIHNQDLKIFHLKKPEKCEGTDIVPIWQMKEQQFGIFDSYKW